MKLTILGCYAATPRTFTNPTSQVLEMRNNLFLIDCGEGTQVQLRKNKIRFSQIDHIFISHLHGDHVYGLIGLVSTFMLLKRTSDLHIYGPAGIKEMITLQLRLANSWTSYGLFFHELTSTASEIVFEDETVIVKTIPLKHRVYTNGYLFVEKPRKRKLNVEAIAKHKIDKSYFRNIKAGRDIAVENGKMIPNSQLTFDPEKPQSYAFCSDTAFHEDIVPIIANVDVLYHESTFLNSEATLAPATMHSTAIEAATIAKKADVGTLILGHYSTRYENIELFAEEASTVFEKVVLADDGKSFEF